MKNDINKHYNFVMYQYKKYFNDKKSKDWYIKTIKSLRRSLIYYEKKKIEEDNQPIKYKLIISNEQEFAPVFAIENLIGLILVLCQTYINNICRNVSNFYYDYEYFSNTKANEIPHSKFALLKNYGNKFNNTNYTEVEIIYTLANYYKHYEEWIGDKNPNSKKTIKIMNNIGLNTKSNFYYAQNLYNSLILFGIDSVKNIFNLINIIDDWKKNIFLAIPELNR